MESHQRTLLETFRNNNDNTTKIIRVNPGVTLQLLTWLETMEFPREPFMANDPLISQKLLIREGIEMVLRRLRQEYEYHEREMVNARS